MSGGPVVGKMSTKPELFFLCLENICVSIYLITSFIDGYIQHLNVIFESENKHGRNVVVILLLNEKKKVWPWTHLTNIPDSLSCLPYLERHKHLFVQSLKDLCQRMEGRHQLKNCRSSRLLY